MKFHLMLISSSFTLYSVQKADASTEFYFQSLRHFMSLVDVRSNSSITVTDRETSLTLVSPMVEWVIMKFSYIEVQTYVLEVAVRSRGTFLGSSTSAGESTVHHTFDEIIDIFNDEDLDYFSLPVTLTIKNFKIDIRNLFFINLPIIRT